MIYRKLVNKYYLVRKEIYKVNIIHVKIPVVHFTEM